jgi:hypothetical protein
MTWTRTVRAESAAAVCTAFGSKRCMYAAVLAKWAAAGVVTPSRSQAGSSRLHRRPTFAMPPLYSGPTQQAEPPLA